MSLGWAWHPFFKHVFWRVCAYFASTPTVEMAAAALYAASMTALAACAYSLMWRATSEQRGGTAQSTAACWASVTGGRVRERVSDTF